MKRNAFVRVICLIASSAVLGSALVVAAVMGSPYETLKRAVLDVLTYRNATMESTMTLTVDGVLQETQKTYNVNGDNSYLSYYYDREGIQAGFFYSSDGLNVYQSYQSRDGTQWYCADVYRYYDGFSSYMHGGLGSSSFMRGGLGMIRPEDRDSAQMRFMELAVDALVGDLKNNITMSSGNGIRYIQGTLTESQVPELAKAAIDMMIEQSYIGSYYTERKISFDGWEYVYEQIRVKHDVKTVTTWKQAVRPMTPAEQAAWADGTWWVDDHDDFWGFVEIDGILYLCTADREYLGEYTVPAVREDYGAYAPLDIPMKSLTVNYIHGNAEIGADGDLLLLNVSGTATVVNIFGDAHIFEINASLRCWDIGTSSPACPVPGVEGLLTPNFMKNLTGYEFGSVFFSLNADGSIDASSVTTTYPGELDRVYYNEAVIVKASDAILLASPAIPSEYEE